MVFYGKPCHWTIKGLFSMNKIQSGIFLVLLTYLPVANAIFIPSGSIILAENSFSGQITDINLDPLGVSQGWIMPGDVTIGSRFTADFALYEDTVTEPGEISFGTQFIFYGINDSYTFELDGGWDSAWGTITVNADNSLLFAYQNNFESDDLESTFNGNLGDDSGGLFMTIDDYTRAGITGFGDFGWSEVNVEFEIATVSIPSPAILWLLGSGLISLIGFSWRKKP